MRSLRNKLKLLYDDFRIFVKLIVGAKSTYKVSLFKKIKMNINGFTSDQYIRYNFKENDMNEYISSMERWKTRRINGRYNLALDDKLMFIEIFGKYINIPKNYAWINNKKIYDLEGGIFTNDDFYSLIKKNKKLFIKPVIGGGGRGVQLINFKNDLIYIDGNVAMIDEIRKLHDYIIVEYVEQHKYSKNIFEKSTNTIRLVTGIDYNQSTASILHAVHRIGVESTVPVDNCSRGALAAKIDLDTGVLYDAKTYNSTNIYTNHPDTGVRIQGVQVPMWEMIKKETIKVAEKFPYISLMAWDIVITDNGFTVIEINASTGLDLFQLWQGERNTKLGEFYKKYNIFK